MARKSIEDVMNEIEDFLNSCKTTALSSNKVIVPRDEFDELFGDLKVKIPAEIDRCKKIMRNKDAILMDARKTADGILAEAGEQAARMVDETEIMAQANQKAYETVEMARVQANDILAQAVADANEIRLGSMRYTNDIMAGIRDYIQATMEAERANYEHLIERLDNDYMVANANLDEIQNQIVEFTGDPNSVVRTPKPKTETVEKKEAVRPRQNMVQKVKQAVTRKEVVTGEAVPVESVSNLTAGVEKTVTTDVAGKTTGQTSLKASESVTSAETAKAANSKKESGTATVKRDGTVTGTVGQTAVGKVVTGGAAASAATQAAGAEMAATTGSDTAVENGQKKVKKKIVKKRNPVIHTPQTAQETVAKTVEAARKVDKTVYMANEEQPREVPAMEGRVKRGPRVGRGLVEEHSRSSDAASAAGTVAADSGSAVGKSLGVVDDFSMEKKI